MACPQVPSYINATHQIYANTPDFDKEDCVELDGLLSTPQPNNYPGAWQYT